MNAAWIKYLPGALRSHLDGRHPLQQAITSTGWLSLDKIARIVLGVVIAIWLARVLGPAQFGKFNYALAYVALFSSVANCGLDGIVVRNLVQNPDDKNLILGSAFMLKLMGALLAIAMCVGSVLLVEPNDALARMLVMVLALGLIFPAFDVVDFWFQSKVASKYAVIAKMPALLLMFGARAVLLLGAASLVAFAWVQALESAMAAVGLVFVYRYLGDRITNWRPALAYAVALIKESWPLILAGLSVMLYMKIDIVMLGKMSGDRETGLYSAASRLSEGFYFVPMVITASFAPLLMRARATARDQYMQSLLKLYVLMVRLSLALAAVLAFVAPWLIEVLFGVDYSESSAVLRVHIWAAIGVFLGVASSQYLTNEGLQKLSLFRTLIGMVTNIVLNLMLIPAYGAMGAAVATLISYFVATFAVILDRRCTEQGKLMLKAMSPKRVLGLAAS